MKIKLKRQYQVGMKTVGEGKRAKKVPNIKKAGHVIEAKDLPNGWADQLVKAGIAEEA